MGIFGAIAGGAARAAAKGIGKGALKGIGKGIGKGALKNLGKGGLMNKLGEGLKNLGGGKLGGLLEQMGGPQGIMDMVQQFLPQGGGGEQAGGAEQAGGGQQAQGGQQAGPDQNNPLVKLLQALTKAKNPAEVDKIASQLKKKLAKQDPKIAQVVDLFAQTTKAMMQQAA